jgi:hypothetical protein
MQQQLTYRPWITTGVVLASASLIAATPVNTPQLPDIKTTAIQLTAGFDPLTEWQEVIQQALANATDIWDHWSPAPFPALQQVLVNQVGFLEEVLKNPSTIADIPTQIEDNFNAAVNAAITPFTPVNPEPYIYPSLDPTPITVPIRIATIFGVPVNTSVTLDGKADLLDILQHGLAIPGTTTTLPVLPLLVGDQAAAEIEQFLPLAGSPLSGVLWGTIGTLLSPALQFDADETAISDAFSGSTPDFTTAFQDLVNAAANITGAFLNGYGDVNLDTLLTDLGLNTLLADAGIIVPPTATADLGGLLSPGGSLLNGLDITEMAGVACPNTLCATFDIPSTAVGPIASMIGLDQAIAEAIGWSGVGNPLEALLNLF